MRENVTLNAGRQWTLEGVQKLQQLWSKDVPLALIAQTLGRPEAEIRVKATELGLHRPS